MSAVLTVASARLLLQVWRVSGLQALPHTLFVLHASPHGQYPRFGKAPSETKDIHCVAPGQYSTVAALKRACASDGKSTGLPQHSFIQGQAATKGAGTIRLPSVSVQGLSRCWVADQSTVRLVYRALPELSRPWCFMVWPA
jgi:hypothetical protein